MTFQELINEMRRQGVKRVAFARPLVAWDMEFSELELEPLTEPTGAPELVDTEPAEEKPANECAVAGCHDSKGFPYAPDYCEKHGLGAFGMKQ